MKDKDFLEKGMCVRFVFVYPGFTIDIGIEKGLQFCSVIERVKLLGFPLAFHQYGLADFGLFLVEAGDLRFDVSFKVEERIRLVGYIGDLLFAGSVEQGGKQDQSKQRGVFHTDEGLTVFHIL